MSVNAAGRVSDITQKASESFLGKEIQFPGTRWKICVMVPVVLKELWFVLNVLHTSLTESRRN